MAKRARRSSKSRKPAVRRASAFRIMRYEGDGIWSELLLERKIKDASDGLKYIRDNDLVGELIVVAIRERVRAEHVQRIEMTSLELDAAGDDSDTADDLPDSERYHTPEPLPDGEQGEPGDDDDGEPSDAEGDDD